MLNFLKWFHQKKEVKASSNFGQVQHSAKDYIIKEEHEKTQSITLKKIRKEFKVGKSADIFPGLGGTHLRFVLNELINYYNNDICITYSNFDTMNKFKEEYDIKIIGYHADSLVLKIVSCWDYLFQILSKYLNTELLGDYDSRDKIILMMSKKMEFVEDGKSTKVIYEDYTKEELNQIIERVKKEKKVLSVDKKNKVLKKAIKELNLTRTNRINILFSLYSSDEVDVIKKKVRNEVTHKRSLGFKTSIGMDMTFPMEGIHFSRDGWYDFNNLSVLIDKNIEILASAIQALSEMIVLDDFPNSLTNADKQFVVYQLKCETCNSILNTPKEFYEINIKSEYRIKCKDCNIDMDKSKEYKINERDYITLYFENMEYFFEQYKEGKN